MPASIPPPPPPPSNGGRRMAIPPPTATSSRQPVHPGGQTVPAPAPAPKGPPEQRPPLNFSDLPVDFEPRDGDVMVVHYGAVKVPLPAGKFGSIEVGGESYSRQLRAGDDVGEQYEKVYGFLKGRAERAAKEKVTNWHSQFSKGEG